MFTQSLGNENSYIFWKKLLVYGKTKPLGMAYILAVHGLLVYRADDGTRTRDLLTTNEVRYHLCHSSIYIILA